MNEELSFEEKMLRLDTIIESMQNSEIGLQESVKLFEEGIKLINSLNSELGGVKEKVRILLDASDEIQLGVFEDENGN